MELSQKMDIKEKDIKGDNVNYSAGIPDKSILNILNNDFFRTFVANAMFSALRKLRNKKSEKNVIEYREILLESLFEIMISIPVGDSNSVIILEKNKIHKSIDNVETALKYIAESSIGSIMANNCIMICEDILGMLASRTYHSSSKYFNNDNICGDIKYKRFICGKKTSYHTISFLILHKCFVMMFKKKDLLNRRDTDIGYELKTSAQVLNEVNPKIRLMNDTERKRKIILWRKKVQEIVTKNIKQFHENTDSIIKKMTMDFLMKVYDMIKILIDRNIITCLDLAKLLCRLPNSLTLSH